jgi:hypothetical protein
MLEAAHQCLGGNYLAISNVFRKGETCDPQGISRRWSFCIPIGERRERRKWLAGWNFQTGGGVAKDGRKLLRLLAAQAGESQAAQSAFLTHAYRALSVRLQRGNAKISKVYSQMLRTADAAKAPTACCLPEAKSACAPSVSGVSRGCLDACSNTELHLVCCI